MHEAAMDEDILKRPREKGIHRPGLGLLVISIAIVLIYLGVLAL